MKSPFIAKRLNTCRVLLAFLFILQQICLESKNVPCHIQDFYKRITRGMVRPFIMKGEGDFILS